jgi:hypothetical protein
MSYGLTFQLFLKKEHQILEEGTSATSGGNLNYLRREPQLLDEGTSAI